MSTRFILLAGLAVALIGANACSSSSHPGPPGTQAARANQPGAVTVASTLSEHATLPERIIWQATPSIQPDQIQEVDFLIDGRLVWVEHDPPYIFGGDDSGANRGYLITTWLSPGSHVFVAKVLDIDGRSASNAVSARVEPTSEPPATLRGIWTRVITGSGPLAGRWELAFDKVGVWELDPQGSGLANELTVRDDMLTISAPIQMAPFDNNQSTTSAYGHHNLGGTDCTPAGCPCQHYRWSRSGDKLTIVVLHCPFRSQVIENGVWTRAPKQIPANLRP
jgi:hypothetical protein